MSDTQRLACFKAYDVRGRVPDDLNEEVAYGIGRAYAAEIQPKGKVAVGRDIRQSSVDLCNALVQGLNEGGVDTVDIGLCGTEMIYYAAGRSGMGGGIMITASHNPMEYNGAKLVREDAIPISGDTGLLEIERRVRTRDFPNTSRKGKHTREDVMDGYVKKVLSFVDRKKLKPLKLVVNAGNGCAGPAFDALAQHLPFDVIRVNHEPDGAFPNGIPNPLLVENQPATADPVKAHNADLGIAWDGDFDRCFFFDDAGEFVEGYYLVGFLAEQMLKQEPGGKVVHDPRLVWNTAEIVSNQGGTAIQSKTGHAFIKERMRREDAVYGGEVSAHHYFKHFSFCDSGMIPWLLVAQAMCERGKTLNELVAERRRRYPCSGEINRRIPDPDAAIARVRAQFEPQATHVDEVDGVSMEFETTWRFNIRKSQTEPILRVNVEATSDRALMEAKTRELLELVDESTG